MKKRKTGSMYLVIFLLFSMLIIIGAFFYYIYLPSEKSELEDRTVVSIIDGDTFQYYDANQNTIKKVRLLCIDTPEENEQGYEEAKAYLEFLILGKQVILEKDISEKDEYDRLLRYVYLENGTFVNREIIRNGYGEILIIRPDVKKCDEISS